MITTHKELLYKMCDNTDFTDAEQAQALAVYLVDELLTYSQLVTGLENKLMELMTAKEFEEFTDDMAKEMTREWVARLPDGDFKDFNLENLEDIMAGTYKVGGDSETD